MGGRRVQMMVEKLQKIIPGGDGLKPDRLLLRTAEYIMLLRFQIRVMQTLSKFHIP